MQHSPLPISIDYNQKFRTTKQYAKQMVGKVTSDNSPQKSEKDHEMSFFQILSNFEKILEYYPQRNEEDMANSTKQSDSRTINTKSQIENYYQQRSRELEKVCTALINLNQDFYLRSNQQQCQTDISLLSQMSFSKEESQAKSTIKELEYQLGDYRKKLDNYRQKVEEEMFKLQVQNDRLKEQIEKLKKTAQLYQKKYEQVLRKNSVIENINQNLQQQITNLKLQMNRARGNSFARSQKNSKYSKDKSPIKSAIQRIGDKPAYILSTQQRNAIQNIGQMEEINQKLIKDLEQEKKSKIKLQVQYNKLMQFMVECEKQLNMKNAIIHQLSNNNKPQRTQYHTRVNTQTRPSKKLEINRRNGIRQSELSPNMFGWARNEPVTLINLLNDNLEIHWLDKIKVVYKLISYFQQKLQWQNFEETSIENFSGININKNRFDFEHRNISYSQQNKLQLNKALNINLCHIIDKLFQIPEIDKCPKQVNKVLQKFIDELENFFDHGVDDFHGFIERLKNFTIRLLVEQ